MIVDQTEFLDKLIRNKIALEEFFKLSRSVYLEKHKMSQEEFLSSKVIPDHKKQHELKHASIYNREGISVDFYYFPNTINNETATSGQEVSIKNWLRDKDRMDFLRLLKEVVSAPGLDMSPADLKQYEILRDIE